MLIHWQKRICIWLAALLILLPVSAPALEMTGIIGRLLGNDTEPTVLDISAEYRSMATFDEHRAEALNRILKHLSLRLHSGKNVSGIFLLADGTEMTGILSRQVENEKQTAFTFDPEKVYVFSDENPLAEASSDDFSAAMEKTERLEMLHRGLEDGYALFCELPGRCGEKAKSTDTKKRVNGFGTAVRSISIQFTGEEAESGVIQELLKDPQTGTTPAFFSGLFFSGRQKVNLLTDEAGRALLIQYSGKAGRSEETMRDIRLEWRCLRTENLLKDQVTVKSPAVKGTDRDNITLERVLETVTEAKSDSSKSAGNRTEGQDTENPEEAVRKEVYSLTCSYDRVAQRERIRTEIKCSLELADQWTGSLLWTDKSTDETNKTEFRPALKVNAAGEYSGTLEILRYSGKIAAEDLMLTLRMGPADDPEWPEKAEILREDGMTADEKNELQSNLLGRAAGIFLRTALGWPPEDLIYLSEGLPEENWSQVIQSISEQ